MSRKKPMAITIRVKKGIRVDGEINRMEIYQDDQTILLTEKQAQSLATEIHRRFPPLVKGDYALLDWSRP